jgi:SAM-dependent methyltransferase
MTDATPGQSEAQWQDFLLRESDPYAMSKYRVLLDWCPPLADKTALVIGCGSGELACLLALQGARTLASDVSADAVELTGKTARRLNAELETTVCALEHFDDGTCYDLVVATDVVEHIEDDDAAARKLVRLTKPGGHVLISVPALQSVFGYHDEVLGHYRRYSRRTLSRLFEPYVELQRIRYFGFLLIPVAFLVSRVLRRPYPIRKVGHAESKPGIAGRLLRSYFALERRIPFPAGTSLLMLGRIPREG